MKAVSPIARDLVLVGGGHAHVIVLRMLGMKPMPGLQVTLVSPDSRTPYSGMLPGVVAGHYTPDDIHIELGPLCRFAGARFIRSRATGIDVTSGRVVCEGRPDVPYDVLSLDIGITPSTENLPGADEHAIAVKPINRFLDKWEAFLADARAGRVQQVGFVGAGAGGIELCLAVHHRLRHEGVDGVGMHLMADSAAPLPGYPAQVQARFEQELASRRIAYHGTFRAAEVRPDGVVSERGEFIALDQTFLVTNAASQDWLAETGLALDERGFIRTGATLQSVSHTDVFAVGDISSNDDYPRPKAGVYAVRQGKPLHDNLRRVLLGQAPKPFRPQQDFLSLISVGGKRAVASKWGQTAAGAWVWQWKNWIDRRFMARFNELPSMAAEPRDGLLADFDDQMQCGGCGAKVAADLLAEVLGEMGVSGDLDDAALYEVPPGKLMLHTVDHFRGFIDDPWVFARIAVNHALSDIYAMGGKPVTALAVMTLPYATPAKTRELLALLMRGSLDQLGAEDVALVGGHTSEGMELSLGFAVNGLIDPDQVHRKGGLVPGQALVLTKPMGTGVLLAADMQAKARGAWVEAATRIMLQSNRDAAALLIDAGATAMTDVTGFGVAGHLGEMLDASGTGAELVLADVPLLPGAREMSAAGIESSLYAGNRRSVAGFTACGDSREPLLFDPQTSGGLLAGVPAEQATDVVSKLRAAGYEHAAVVGHVTETGGITVR